MLFTYCPVCGEKLTVREIGDEGMTPFCEKCSRPWFSLSYPCVLVLVENELGEMALIRQAYVSVAHYVTVAGYIKSGENAEEAAAREVGEELGVKVVGTRYIRSFYYPKRDNLMLGFICHVKKKDFQISAEVDNAGWFSKKEALSLMRDGSTGQQLLAQYTAEKNEQH